MLGGGQRPPGVHPRDDVGTAALVEQARDAEEEGRYASRPLHPAHARRQQRVFVAVLDETPVRPALTVVDRAADNGLGERHHERKVLVLTVALPDIEDHVADTCRATTAAVVVPEARVAALGDARPPQGVQT